MWQPIGPMARLDNLGLDSVNLEITNPLGPPRLMREAPFQASCILSDPPRHLAFIGRSQISNKDMPTKSSPALDDLVR